MLTLCWKLNVPDYKLDVCCFKAMQSRFTVYRHRPHVILAALVNFHLFIITRDRASPLTRAPSATPLSLGYEINRQRIIIWHLTWVCSWQLQTVPQTILPYLPAQTFFSVLYCAGCSSSESINRRQWINFQLYSLWFTFHINVWVVTFWELKMTSLPFTIFKTTGW